MTQHNLENLVRQYATGQLTWHDLQAEQIDYYDVLAELGRLSLRPPVAPMSGPNLDARKRGIAIIESMIKVGRG